MYRSINHQPKQLAPMRILLTFAAMLLFLSAKAQTITPEQAKDHIGEHITVCGKVTGVRINKINAYLYFGDVYPNYNFTLVIPGKVARRDKARQPYADVFGLKGKDVCLTGKVEQFKQKPGMTLSAFSAMKVQ